MKRIFSEMQDSVANIVTSHNEEEAKIRREGHVLEFFLEIQIFLKTVIKFLTRNWAKARKVVEIETALRIGDLVALRELAAQKHGLVEG